MGASRPYRVTPLGAYLEKCIPMIISKSIYDSDSDIDRVYGRGLQPTLFGRLQVMLCELNARKRNKLEERRNS